MLADAPNAYGRLMCELAEKAQADASSAEVRFGIIK